MSTGTLLAVKPLTSAPSYSFYLGPTDHDLIRLCAQHSDALTIRGASGPQHIAQLRAGGLDVPVLFDREAWRAKPGATVAPGPWIDAQATAGADRLLTPGRYVPWSSDAPTEQLKRVALELALARRWEAVPLLAVDARWLGRDAVGLADALKAGGGPVALVLVEGGDPLALSGAVQGLRYVAATVPGLMILRSDHGALGAVAFGARHAALGLRPGDRHGTTPDRRGFGKQGDRTARVFVYAFADWFTAATIAGWALADPGWARCGLECCRGQDLSRFLDEDYADEVRLHNVLSLRQLADLVLDADGNERRTEFLGFCQQAADRYGRSGFRGPQDPKAQLTGWVLS